MKKKFIIIILFVCFSALNCQNDDLAKTRREQVVLNDVENQIIVINNPSVQSCKFNLDINGKFFLTLNKVKKLLAESKNFDKTQAHKDAWQWIMTNTRHGEPLNNDQWLYNFNLFINSVGYGYCSHRASALTQLWGELGFEARVWDLTGHVVPEVKQKNSWQMFDPDTQIFAINSTDKVASVEEISTQNTKYVNIWKSSKFINSDSSALDFFYKPEYISTDDNKIAPWFYDNLPVIDSHIVMPAYSKLECCFEERIPASSSQPMRFLKLTVSPNTKGILYLPLILKKIEGSVKIKTNNKVFEMPNGYNEIYNTKPAPIEIISVNDSAVFYFSINPYLRILDQNNVITLQGEHVNKLHIEHYKSNDPIIFAEPSVINCINDELFFNNYSIFTAKVSGQVISLATFKELVPFYKIYLESFEMPAKEKAKLIVKMEKRLIAVDDFLDNCNINNKHKLLSNLSSTPNIYSLFTKMCRFDVSPKALNDYLLSLCK